MLIQWSTPVCRRHAYLLSILDQLLASIGGDGRVYIVRTEDCQGGNFSPRSYLVLTMSEQWLNAILGMERIHNNDHGAFSPMTVMGARGMRATTMHYSKDHAELAEA